MGNFYLFKKNPFFFCRNQYLDQQMSGIIKECFETGNFDSMYDFLTREKEIDVNYQVCIMHLNLHAFFLN